MNPFNVLGIAPIAVRGLTDEKIATLVKAMYRALSLIHHPDRGGKRSKFQSLQEAVEELDWEANPEQFRYWREQLLRTPKQKLADAVREQSAAARRQQIAEDSLLDYARIAAGLEAAPEGTTSIFRIGDVRLLISETLVTRWVGRQNPGSPTLGNYISCCELEVVGGVITRYSLLKKTFNVSDGEAMPPHDEAWGRKGAKKGTRDVWIRKGKGDLLRDTRIVGAIPQALLNRDYGASRGLTALLSVHDDNAGGLPCFSLGYDWDAFRVVGVLMKPYFAKQDELICGTADRFIPVGQIWGICAIADWPTA